MTNSQGKQAGKKKIVIRSSRKRRLKGRLLALWQEHKWTAVAGILSLVGILMVVVVIATEPSSSKEQANDVANTSAFNQGRSLVQGELDFAYPELLPYASTKIDPSFQEEVVTRDDAIAAFLRNKGIPSDMANEVARQADQESLRAFKEGHKLFTFRL